MLVIFEGNEGSGKSTLAKMLADKYQTTPMKMHSHKNWSQETDMYPYPWHMNKAAVWTWRFLMEMLRPTIVTDERLYISDRSFITQAVYHPVFSKDDMDWFSESAYEAMPKHLATIPHIVFHIDRDSIRKNDDMLIEYRATEEQINQINDSYSEYYNSNKDQFNLFRIDNNNKTIDQVFSEIDDIYKNQLTELFGVNSQD